MNNLVQQKLKSQNFNILHLEVSSSYKLLSVTSCLNINLRTEKLQSQRFKSCGVYPMSEMNELINYSGMWTSWGSLTLPLWFMAWLAGVHGVFNHKFSSIPLLYNVCCIHLITLNFTVNAPHFKVLIASSTFI